MISFRQYVESHMNIKMPEGSISGAWFSENGLPMVVACSCCGMTMASPSAWIDDEGYTYCSDCTDVDEIQLSKFEDPFGVPDDYNEGWQ